MIKPGILTGNRYFESHRANKVIKNWQHPAPPYAGVQKLSKDLY